MNINKLIMDAIHIVNEFEDSYVDDLTNMKKVLSTIKQQREETSSPYIKHNSEDLLKFEDSRMKHFAKQRDENGKISLLNFKQDHPIRKRFIEDEKSMKLNLAIAGALGAGTGYLLHKKLKENKK